VTVADNAVDRPLVDVVIEAIDADNDLSDEAKYYVLAALEGPTSLQELLDGISTPHVPEPTGSQLLEEPVGAFLTSITVAGFRGIGPKAVLGLHPGRESRSLVAATDWASPASPRPSIRDQWQGVHAEQLGTRLR